MTLSLTPEGGGCPGLYTEQGGHPHHNLSECALCLAYGDGGESKRRRRHLFIAIHIPANFTDNINFTPSDRVVSLTAELTTPVFRLIYIRATTATEQATLVLQLAAVDPPPLAAAFDDSRPIVLTGYSGLVATVNSGGRAGELPLRSD